MGRIEFDFTFYVWYRSEENSSNVNWGAMGDVVVVIRYMDISDSLQLEVAAHWRASSIHFETNMKK